MSLKLQLETKLSLENFEVFYSEVEAIAAATDQHLYTFLTSGVRPDPPVRPVIHPDWPEHRKIQVNQEFSSAMKKLEDFERSSRNLCGKIYLVLEPIVKAKLDADRTIAPQRLAGNVYRFIQALKSICQGTGSTNLNLTFLSAANLKAEKGSLETYMVQFRQYFDKLESRKTPAELYDMIKSCIFLRGLEHIDTFKHHLTVNVKPLENWPNPDALFDTLQKLQQTEYDEAAIAKMTIGHAANQAVLKATAESYKTSRQSCYACGVPGHKKGDAVCNASHYICSHCGKRGHFEPFCELKYQEKSTRSSTSGTPYSREQPSRPSSISSHSSKAASQSSRTPSHHSSKLPYKSQFAPQSSHPSSMPRSSQRFPSKSSAKYRTKAYLLNLYFKSQSEEDDLNYTYLKTLISSVEDLSAEVLVDYALLYQTEPDDVSENLSVGSQNFLSAVNDQVFEDEDPTNLDTTVADDAYTQGGNEPHGDYVVEVHDYPHHPSSPKVVVYELLNKLSTSKDEFVVDTGCAGGHLTNNSTLVSQLQQSSNIQVSGFSGPSYGIDGIGKFLGTSQKIILLKRSTSNLLSVKELIQNGEYYEGDSAEFRLFNSSNQLVFRAPMNRKGYYTIATSELLRVYGRPRKSVQILHEDAIFLNTDQRSRAAEARRLHVALGHPSDRAMIAMLDTNALVGCNLASQAVRDALTLFGPCPACLSGKMKDDPQPLSTTPPASRIGERVHMDIIPLTGVSIGGYTFGLLSKCAFSDYSVWIPLENKSTLHLCQALERLISFYLSYGYKIDHFFSDGENNLLACRTFVEARGCTLQSTPRHFHEKTIEARVRTVKMRKRAIENGLPYKVPIELESELFQVATQSTNMVPTTRTHPLSPFQVFKKIKPDAPIHHFGELGMFHYTSKNLPTVRAEAGIFISHGAHSKVLRAYLPYHRRIFVVRKMVPIPSMSIPPEWNFLPSVPLPIPSVQPSRVIASSIPPPVSSSTHSPTVDPSSVSEGTSRSPVFIPTPTPHISLPDTPQEGTTSTSMVDDLHPTLIPEGIPVVQAPFIAPIAPIIGAAPIPLPTPAPATLPQPIPKVVPDTRPPPQPPPRQSSRSIRPPKRYQHMHIFLNQYSKRLPQLKIMHTSLKKALLNQSRRDSILQSIYDEIDNLADPKIMTPILRKDIPAKYAKDIIRVWLFHKEKVDSHGNFLKDKCRIVTLSQLRDRSTIGETFAPTANPISVFTVIQISATVLHRTLSAYDIKAAFLQTPIPVWLHHYLCIPPDIVFYWIQRYPHMKSFVHTDGCLYFKLHRFLYGLHESPHEFNSMLDGDLKAIGFQQSASDKCLYTKKTPEGFLYLNVHVDDMLLSAPSAKLRDWFEKSMGKKYELSPQRDNITYLGMNISNTRDGIIVHQHGYLDGKVKKFLSTIPNTLPATPAGDDLTSNPVSPAIPTKDYLSLVMSLMYLGRFTRPDILLPVTYLASRSATPTQADYKKLIRILCYAHRTRRTKMVFSRTADLIARIYADASHHFHRDSKGHGGIFITLGSAPVLGKSFKLRLTTRSSTESELVALEEAVTFAIWYKRLLVELGIGRKHPITIHQDNLSTMDIANKGGGQFSRNKHIGNRHALVTENITNRNVTLQHLDTKNMPADMLTKPLPYPRLQHLLRLLHLN